MVMSWIKLTKFCIGIVFRKAQVSAKFHCPTSTVTLFSEYGERRIHSSPVIEGQKSPANSGGTIVYNCPCYVRRRGCLLLNLGTILLTRRKFTPVGKVDQAVRPLLPKWLSILVGLMLKLIPYTVP